MQLADILPDRRLVPLVLCPYLSVSIPVPYLVSFRTYLIICPKKEGRIVRTADHLPFIFILRQGKRSFDASCLFYMHKKEGDS